MKRHSTKMGKIIARTQKWEDTDPKYRFVLAPV